MARPDFPFDAVLFDLDGTLVATDRFWPDAARVGAKRAFAELGLERQLPRVSDWMGMVGLSLEEGFGRVFADLTAEQRACLIERCLEEEKRLLSDGRAAMLPGVREALEELRGLGVRTGIASNCPQYYLDTMMGDLGLERWIEHGRCLDTPGIGDKADMIEDLLLTFGTRSAAMVGDRAGDRDAAWANGLPHVHLARGYAEVGEDVLAEATIEGFDELLATLRKRTESLVGLARSLELPDAALVLGITGGPGAGKTQLALDLARELERGGRAAQIVGLEQFARPGAGPLDPVRIDTQLELTALSERADAARGAPSGSILVLEGPGLLAPALAPFCDRIVAVEVEDELALRRIAGRDARLSGPAALIAARAEGLPAQAAFEARYPAAERADCVVDGSRPFGPLQSGPVTS
ncbi:MAG: HAD hydrolase-like protein [bacterium]|nr:HAD hydrolase-like protein [bacterium]